jgi:hypothetical protein
MHTHKHEQKVWQMTVAQKNAIAKSTRELRTSDDEFEAAFKILKKYPKRVTFFGSARLLPDTKYYNMAHDLAVRMADNGFAIISGGGNGIMEASNRGAFDGENVSVGFNIKLPHEQHLNSYTTDSLQFNFFFTRKVMMTFYTHAFVCFPGGFGTLDEVFEVMTLIQTGKMPPVPIIFVGNKYWKDLDKFIRKNLLKNHLVSNGDEQIYTITEDFNTIVKIINKSYNS